MTEFNWKINQLERTTADNYVLVVHYGVDAVDGEYSKGAYGTISFDPESKPASVDFDSLTEETVLGWVFAEVEKETVEAQLGAVIAEMKEPSVIAGTPWDVQVEEVVEVVEE